MRKKGPHKKPNRRCYIKFCRIDGIQFMASRPEAKTCCATCRALLSDFKALYGCEPVKPPGRRFASLLPFDPRPWYREFLPSTHPLNNPAPQKKTRAARR